jgi:hypothetical protein
MTRRVLGVLLVVGSLCSATAAAQVALGRAHTPGVTFQRSPEAPRPTTPPPRPNALVHPRGDHAPAPTTGDLFLAGARTYAPHRDRHFSRVRPYQTFSGYFPTPHLPVLAAALVVPESPMRSEVVAGYLKLQVVPADAQVFVDGFYVGTIEDFTGSQYALEAGAHRIEIRATGYATVSVEVIIRPGQLTTYSKELSKLQSAERSPDHVETTARAAMPKAIYVIPRCYAGDRPPVAGQLPVGCDIGALRIIAPGVR